MKDSHITIIGFGNVGRALFQQFIKNGLKVVSVCNRSEISPEIQKKFSEVNFIQGLPDSTDEIGDYIFITVSDDALKSVTENLATRYSDFRGKSAYHCSGTHSSAILLPLKEKGAKTASFHPMKAITPETTSFENTWFDTEGDEEAVEFLTELAVIFGAKTFTINAESKPYLHAAAVVASNYLVVLADLVSKISEAGGIPKEKALQSIIPLMENTLRNIEEMGPVDALTGPVSRGDVNTVKQHLKILENKPELASLYKMLGMEAIRLTAQKRGESAALEEIKKLFS